MSILPYRAVEFVEDEVVLQEELDQLQSNYQWINDNTPRGRFFREEGRNQDTKLMLLCGKALVKKNNKESTASVNVTFEKSFSPACNPQVTTGVVCDFSKKVFVSLRGPGGKGMPDNTGFTLNVDIAEEKEKLDKIANEFWIHWHAFGYRTDDMNEF